MELNYFLDSSNYKEITISGNHYGDNYPNPYKSLIKVTRERFTFKVTEGKGKDLPSDFEIIGDGETEDYVMRFLVFCNSLKHAIIDYDKTYNSSEYNDGEFKVTITFENDETLEYSYRTEMSFAADDLSAGLGFFVEDKELPYGYKLED